MSLSERHKLNKQPVSLLLNGCGIEMTSFFFLKSVLAVGVYEDFCISVNDCSKPKSLLGRKREGVVSIKKILYGMISVWL